MPRSIVTNDDLALRMDTSDEWIVTRTGIRRRHHCAGETQTGLCIQAAQAALARSGVRPGDIGVCLVATMSPERMMPSTACMVQGALGLPGDTLCFDLNAACTGFVYALHTAECLLAASGRKMGLVIGGEALSRMVDWEDRGSCILFGDGAGAVVVEARREWPSIGTIAGCEGNDALLRADGPGSGRPPRIAMEGQKVFRFAVETVSACITRVLEKHGAAIDSVDWFVLHQANARIIDLVR
ncbi:MAG: beta-ketoacyl-ACP synthase 3, partial [Aristaeellaceae bacterium]